MFVRHLDCFNPFVFERYPPAPSPRGVHATLYYSVDVERQNDGQQFRMNSRIGVAIMIIIIIIINFSRSALLYSFVVFSRNRNVFNMLIMFGYVFYWSLGDVFRPCLDADPFPVVFICVKSV